MILLTKSSVPIIGQVASIMGWIMDGIYRVLDLVGIQNLGLCIIIFSIIIYALMTPLQVKQQKFSKLSSVMQPELQKIQKKYKDKKDQASVQKMQEETQLVYQKYGVSPTGSCVQLLIQFPVLMALWQVIYKIPGYVGSVKNVFTGLVDQITSVSGYTDLIQSFITDNKMTRVQLALDNGKATSNSVIDFLYALSPSQWKDLASMDQFKGFADTINTTSAEISKMQNFCGLNIADQPNENMKKMEKQRTKEGLPPQKITNQANQSTKNINTKIDKGSSNTNAEERARKVEESYQNARNAKPGSIAAKANMVRDFDERNKKK